jgi:hypothetical protein
MSKERFPSSYNEIEEEIKVEENAEKKIENPIEENSQMLPYYPSFYFENYTVNQLSINKMENSFQAFERYVENFYKQGSEYDPLEQSDSELQWAIQESLKDQAGTEKQAESEKLLPGKDIFEAPSYQKSQGRNEDWGQGGSGAGWESSQNQDLMKAKTRFDDDQLQKPNQDLMKSKTRFDDDQLQKPKGHFDPVSTIKTPEQLLGFVGDDSQSLQGESIRKLSTFEKELLDAGVTIDEIINQSQFFERVEKKAQSPSAQRLEGVQAKTRNPHN